MLAALRGGGDRRLFAGSTLDPNALALGARLRLAAALARVLGAVEVPVVVAVEERRAVVDATERQLGRVALEPWLAAPAGAAPALHAREGTTIAGRGGTPVRSLEP
jgi:hypothetical protein